MTVILSDDSILNPRKINKYTVRDWNRYKITKNVRSLKKTLDIFKIKGYLKKSEIIYKWVETSLTKSRVIFQMKNLKKGDKAVYDDCSSEVRISYWYNCENERKY